MLRFPPVLPMENVLSYMENGSIINFLMLDFIAIWAILEEAVYRFGKKKEGDIGCSWKN